MNAGIGTKMYKSLRFSVLSRILDDKVAVRGTKTGGFITLRSYSGKDEENGRQTEIVPFYTFLDNQINQARRSLLFDVETTRNYEQLISLCEKFGRIKCMICSVLSKGNKIALIEMEDRNSYQSLLSNVIDSTSKCLPRMPSPFVSADYNSLVVTLTNLVISDIEQVDMSEGSVNWKKLPKQQQTLWTLYNKEKMNELSLRLRFLVVAQMNNIIGGLWNNAVVFPFGGSVNGFGSRFSDLDLTVFFKSNDNRKFLTYKSKLSGDESQAPQSRYVRVISKILKDFAPGCEFVLPISSARVPIVKFYQEYVDLECDLSVDSESGLVSTEILYIISYLHSLVKPLVVVIKKWAKEVNITSKTPGKSISNYGLLSMVVFFLQQKQVGNLDLLPPLVIFPLRPQANMLPDAVYNVARERMGKALSEEEQEKLLDRAAFLFFDFYSNFNFKLNGICIRTGKVVPNTGASSLLIPNPLDRTLNVAKQVGDKEIRKMKMYFHIAKELYKKKKYFNANFMDESYYVKEMAELTKSHGRENRNVVEGHVS